VPQAAGERAILRGVLECVINVSEGRDRAVLDALAAAAGDDLLDLHVDGHHHRAVLTVVGEHAPRSVATVAVERVDLRVHHGAHPRLGAVDVVPFVALAGSSPADARRARDAFAEWAGRELQVPCFVYDGERTLPELRRRAFVDLAPDHGPATAHPTAGATAVGARGVLVAYNVWLATPSLHTAREIAQAIRRPELRALGLAVGPDVQVSMNLVVPAQLGPADAYDLVAARAPVARAELVGLAPRSVLDAVDPARWATLDLDEDRTIEARLAARALRGR
jgi:glutamate formiminotransferase/glutamate formiminotransferase/formiminotetrahydrofolate cyclodeaminase